MPLSLARCSAALLAASLGGPLLAAPPADVLQAPSIAEMAQVPGLGLQAILTTEGDLIFMSMNGRFAVLHAQVVDLWNGKEIKTFGDAKDSAARVDLKRLGLEPADLGAITVGTGPATFVFYDPFCPHCDALLAQIAGQLDTHTFHLIGLPVLGEASADAVLNIVCQRGADVPAATALVLSRDFKGLARPTAGCGQAEVQRALVTAQMLGIQGVPYLVGPDGTTSQGAPGNLAAWLAATAGAALPVAATSAVIPPPAVDAGAADAAADAPPAAGAVGQ